MSAEKSALTVLTRRDGSTSESHGEKRGYSWPSFENGNTAAVTHGARSPRVIETKAQQVHDELVKHAPWLIEAHFAPAVVRYLQAAAREQLLHQHIEQVTAEKGAGAVPSRTWEQVTAAARLAAKLGQDLGLDPIGHARLKAVAANAAISVQSLADLSAEGRKARLAAEARTSDAEAVTDVDELEDGE